MNSKRKLNVVLANPRGLCAGVERAIEIVERAIDKYGPPVYVKHEIIHNKYVVDSLKAKGAIFVEDISHIPERAVTIFSAHGVPESCEDESDKRNLNVIDATCPLVKKVHYAVKRHNNNHRKVILIGHSNHPEVIGTSGRIKNHVYIVESIDDVNDLNFDTYEPLAYATQTTLSIDDTKSIITALHSKFKNLEGPDIKDICYATQNRQNAVKAILPMIDALLVIGAKNSSNSNRLRDLGATCNKPSYLIDDASNLKLEILDNVQTLGITAGASAPDILLQNLLMLLSNYYDTNVNMIGDIEENIKFKLPKQLDSVSNVESIL
ncbi:MAG: 4-hydroxy-3-methylbut-2-enyl diphosphate reductase [Candidatus Lariskella arthropodorum]